MDLAGHEKQVNAWVKPMHHTHFDQIINVHVQWQCAFGQRSLASSHDKCADPKSVTLETQDIIHGHTVVT